MKELSELLLEEVDYENMLLNANSEVIESLQKALETQVLPIIY